MGDDGTVFACCEHCEGAPTSRCWVAESIDGHAEPCPQCSTHVAPPVPSRASDSGAVGE